MTQNTTKSILCIDDEKIHRHYIARILNNLGYSVYETSNASDGLTIVNQFKPDIVLLDLYLPDAYGIDVLNQIKTVSPNLPVIIISGAGEIKDVIQALRAGAWDYIIKPAKDISMIDHTIKKSLERADLIAKNREYETNLEKLVAQKTEALRKSEEKYRTIFENLHDIYFEVLMDGTIIEVSPSIERNSSYKRSDIIGTSIWNLYANKQDRQYFLDKILLNHRLVNEEVLCLDKDGTEIPCSVFCELRFNEKGAPSKICGTLRNITQRKKFENELKQHQLLLEEKVEQRTADLEKAKHIAEEATRSKSEFLANMSHEIRSPLNGVIASINLLMYTELSPEQQEYAKMTKTSADMLLSVINSILDFSKIEAGKIVPENINFDLRTLLEDTGELMAVRAQEKEVELVSIVNPDVPSLLKGDPGYLRQIINNLVDNAIKFTNEGEVIINVSLIEEDDENALVYFEIIDTGIGIPAERLNILFNPFTQADSSTTRKFGGTGLGLSICKKLAELMGGEIGAKNNPDRGSTFWLKMKFNKQPKTSIPVHTISKDIKGVRILIVDHHYTNRNYIKTLLDFWECRYDEATNAYAAFEKLHAANAEKDPFRIAILDMHIPGVNAELLGTKIKQNPLISSTKLVMMTSIGGRGDAKRLESLGFSAYLTKPIKQWILYETITAIVCETRTEGEKSDQIIITKHSIADAKRRKTRILLAEDNIINQKVARRILDKFGFTVETVSNGKEAVHAMQSYTYHLILMDCHMPEMDGYEATKFIRQFSQVPIIALTARALYDDRAKCIKAGMNDYIAKPFEPEKLLETLNRWLVQSEPSIPEEIPPELKLAINESVFNQSWFLDRLQGDVEFAKEVVNAYLQEAPAIIQKIKEAMKNRDAKQLRQKAHALKGASGDVGAVTLKSIAYALEKAGENEDLEKAANIISQLDEQMNRLKTALNEFMEKRSN